MSTRLEDFIWACGLFEGEGSFGVYRISALMPDEVMPGLHIRHRLSIRLTMTDLDIVQRFAQSIDFPGRVDGPLHYKSSVKPLWQWSATGTALALSVLVERMQPWLGDRRRRQGARLQAYAWLREGQSIRRGAGWQRSPAFSDHKNLGGPYWENDRCIDCGTHVSEIQRPDED